MNECKNNILAHRSRFLYEMNSLMKPQRENGLKDQFLVDLVDERWSSVSSGRCGLIQKIHDGNFTIIWPDAKSFSKSLAFDFQFGDFDSVGRQKAFAEDVVVWFPILDVSGRFRRIVEMMTYWFTYI